MNDGREDWLWDRRGEPDPQVAALESELARHRWSGRLPQVELPRSAEPARRAAWRPALAASLAAAALFAGSLWWWSRSGSSHVAPAQYLESALAYRAEALAGTLDAAELRTGDRLVTDAATRARVAVGDIGSLVVEPDSVVRIERPGPGLAADAEHLLWLERGAVTASIFAAPRLFQLGTPAGLAVDLGCVYTARVQDDGTTRLAVVSGQVAFEAEQRRVTVPSGASTVARPGRGPQTPAWDDAPQAWRAAVERLDEQVARGAAPEALDGVLAGARAEDSLTLWHLLAWPALQRDDRARVLDRLAQRAPLPEGVSREACLALEEGALEAWRDELGWSW